MPAVDGLTWNQACSAMKIGRRIRRADWITYIMWNNGTMTFDLPADWNGGRGYKPTETDAAANDWQIVR